MSAQKHLQEIYNINGTLTPDLVLHEASQETHPLHRYFEWDDSQAAAKFRLVQAAELIRSVKITIERSPASEPLRVRAWVSKADLVQDGPGEYLPVETVAMTDIYRQQWFASLKRDWERLKRKAAHSQEFVQMVLSDLQEEAS
jgi:hypothetical protein